MSSRAASGGLVRRVGHLAGGSAAGQAVALLAAPILARVYGPDAFGALAAFSSLALLLAAVASLRYEAGIPLADTDAAGFALLRLSVRLAVAVAAVVGIAAVGLVAWLPVPPGGVAWPPLLALAVLAVGLYQAYSGWAVRAGATGVLGRTRVAQSGAAVGSQLVLAASAGGVGLIVGEVVGRVVGIGTLWRLVRREVPTTVRDAAPPLGAVARQYRSLAGYLLPATLASTAAVHLPVVLAPGLFGAAAGGALYMVVRVGMAPALLLGTAIGQVLLGDLGGRGDLTSARDRAEGILATLTAVYLPLYAAVVATAPFLAATVLGAEWARAGVVARELSPLLLTWSIASPLSVLLLVGRRESESFVVSVLDLVGRMGAVLVGWLLGSFTVAMVAYGVVGGTVGAVSVVRCFRAVGAPLGPALARTGPAVLAAVASAAAAAGVVALPVPDLVAVAGVAVVGLAAAAGASLATRGRGR